MRLKEARIVSDVVSCGPTTPQQRLHMRTSLHYLKHLVLSNPEKKRQTVGGNATANLSARQSFAKKATRQRLYWAAMMEMQLKITMPSGAGWKKKTTRDHGAVSQMLMSNPLMRLAPESTTVKMGKLDSGLVD
jgi:hypothetical protein